MSKACLFYMVSCGILSLCMIGLFVAGLPFLMAGINLFITIPMLALCLIGAGAMITIAVDNYKNPF